MEKELEMEEDGMSRSRGELYGRLDKDSAAKVLAVVVVVSPNEITSSASIQCRNDEWQVLRN